MSHTLTLRRLPEGWTPPETWERMTIPTDRNGERLSTPRILGWRGRIIYTLNLATRELSAQPVGYVDSDTDRVALGEPARLSHTENGILPAKLLLGVLSLEYEPHVATGEVANSLLEELEPLAREVADGAVVVPGLPGTVLDWSPEAVDAYWAAEHLIDRRPYRGTEHNFPRFRGFWYVDTGEVFRRRPDLIDPAWADCGDQDLPFVLTDFGGRIEKAAADDPELYKTLMGLSRDSQVSPPHHDENRGPRLTPVGRRAWLYRHRQEQAGGLDVVDIRWWSGVGVHAHRVQDSSTDADLQEITDRAVQDAATQGVKLVGTTEWAADLRTQRRTEVREQLATLGAEITETEATLKPKKQQRRALLARVMAWGTGDTDSHLGRVSGLSHTAVRSLREALNEEDDD